MICRRAFLLGLELGLDGELPFSVVWCFEHSSLLLICFDKLDLVKYSQLNTNVKLILH